MKYSLNLEKHLQNVIGRAIEYDIETGITTVETDYKLTQGHNIVVEKYNIFIIVK